MIRNSHEYIDIIRSHSTELQQQFGITSMRLFGSVARNEHREGSDVDIYVTMPPKFFNYIQAAQYLEELLGCSVDLISDHKNLRPFFKEQIERDGIDIFTAAQGRRGNMEDIAIELSLLHSLSGIQFVKQLEKITQYGGFALVKGETAIYSVGGEYDGDYDALLDAAHKAVEHGNTVYLLPNPRNCRTADFIFKKKGAYMMYDLKTVYGKGSVGTQLLDSIGQSNRILLNITSDYNGRLLAADIKAYFEANRNAVEVLLFKGKKTISVNRYSAQSPMFYRQFRKIYEQ